MKTTANIDSDFRATTTIDGGNCVSIGFYSNILGLTNIERNLAETILLPEGFLVIETEEINEDGDEYESFIFGKTFDTEALANECILNDARVVSLLIRALEHTARNK